MTGRPPTWLLALAVPVIALIAIVATRVIEGPSDAAVARVAANAVVIKQFRVSHPQRLTVSKGTKLDVANDDSTAHTLTARDGSFSTGNLDGGTKATVALQRSGTFRYFCQIHNFMTGTLVVK